MAQVTYKNRITADGRSLFEQLDYEETDLTSTSSYATILDVEATKVTGGTIIIRNSGATNTLNAKILGSLKKLKPTDDTDESWTSLYSTEDAGESAIATSSSIVKSYSDNYKWILVQIKNGAGVTTAKAWHRGVN